MGVGGAKVIDLLTELGFVPSNITAIDISPQIISLVKNIFPDVIVRSADISSANVLDDLSHQTPFDLITANMVFNHLDDLQLAQALSHIYQMLPDLGVLVALIPHPNFPDRFAKLHDHLSGYSTVESTPWGEPVVYHHRPLWAYHEFFELTGFFPSCISHLPSRLLIVGHKYPPFKTKLDELGYSPALIDHHTFLPHSRSSLK